ncbi:MAG: hypothetical protein RL588_968 [Pseudomonadota bacterium]|jgi:predicted acylesterase/phospholipase RssA
MQAEAPSIETYHPEDFPPRPDAPCDLILEGGVASGAVHPYVVLELARKHRLHAIGATSAGANAGVLAAAAEYARTVRGDPGGFLRLQKICEDRAGGLGELFQESPGFEPLMALVKGRGGLLARLPAAFGRPLATGGLAGAALGLALAFAGGGGPASLTALLAMLVIALGGAVLGPLAAVGVTGLGLARRFNARLGVCTGLTQRGRDLPAITDWLHESIQAIAYGDSPGPVLTFGDLEAQARPPIRLRLITSNLSQQKPHTLPEAWPEGRYRPAEWARLFPPAILEHLEACTRNTGEGTRSLPHWCDLPILVASRMSMSVPGLFEPVPVELVDVETPRRVRELAGSSASDAPLRGEWRRVLFSDGGFTSNFPIHLFDAPLPAWPTYAVDFEALPPGAEGASRVVIVEGATDTRIHPTGSAGDVFGAVLATSRNWNDLLLSLLPIHRGRIARVHLAADQGGFNLSMGRDEVRTLMRYGLEAGRQLAATAFEGHQVLRARALYAGLVQVSRQARKVWIRDGLGADFRDGAAPAGDLTPQDRRHIADALDALAGIAALPRPRNAALPDPAGQTRITPRY